MQNARNAMKYNAKSDVHRNCKWVPLDSKRSIFVLFLAIEKNQFESSLFKIELVYVPPKNKNFSNRELEIFRSPEAPFTKSPKQNKNPKEEEDPHVEHPTRG